MKRKKLVLTGSLLASMLLLSACNLFDSNEKEDGNTASTVVVEKTNSSETSVVSRNAQELFNKMLNIAKAETEDEKHEIITSVLYDPAAYYKSLVNSQTVIPTEKYYKMSAAHSDIKVEKLGANHYYYSALVTIEKQQEISSEPSIGRSYLSMEIKEFNGVLKIVRLEMKH